MVLNNRDIFIPIFSYFILSTSTISSKNTFIFETTQPIFLRNRKRAKNETEIKQSRTMQIETSSLYKCKNNNLKIVKCEIEI